MKNVNYNSEVRKAISDRYVHYSHIKRDRINEKMEIEDKLKHPDKHSYEDYCTFQKISQNLSTEIKELEIKIITLDEAREICLNVADSIKEDK